MSHEKGIMENTEKDSRIVKTANPELTIGAADRKRRRRKKEPLSWLPLLQPQASCFLQAFILLVCIFLQFTITAGFVIAPPWANPLVNVCSKKSWQLIYWPQDEKCYQIFEQGPCPRSQVTPFILSKRGMKSNQCVVVI